MPLFCDLVPDLRKSLTIRVHCREEGKRTYYILTFLYIVKCTIYQCFTYICIYKHWSNKCLIIKKLTPKLTPMNFTFRLKEPNTDKESLIFFRTYFAKERKEFVFSTGEKIKPKEWDFDIHQPNNLRGRTKEAETHRTIKKQLNRYSDYFLEVVNQHKNINEELTLSKVKHLFNKKFKKTKIKNDFFASYDVFIEERKNDYTGNAIVKSTVEIYKRNQSLLEEFQNKNKIKLSFANFDDKVYNKFLKFCIEDKNHSANTLHRNVGLMKTFFYWALDNKQTYNTAFIKFKKPPQFATDEIALNIDQVKEVYDFDFSNNTRLERVRDLFVLGCTTGLRFGNYSRIHKNDIQDGFIRVIDMKSKTKNLSIPLNPISLEILEKYDFDLPQISNQKMNKYIKEVFQIVGFTDEVKKTMKYGDELVEIKSKFYERISSHTARRSFITIMKNQGVPDKLIMSITGHKSLAVFNNYYRPSEKDKVEYMNLVFK